MKMIKSASKTLVAAAILLLISMGMQHSAMAQDDSENESMLLSISEFHVKMGENMAFQEGVKAWKSCYLENEGEWTWNVWSRINGEGTVYYLTSYSGGWAEFDRDDSAAMSCYRQAAELIMPAVKSVTNHFAYTMPGWSMTPSGDQNTVVDVSYFRVKNYPLFNELASTVMNIIEEETGSKRTMWYRAAAGGPDSYHYMNVYGYEDMAAMDEPMDSAWQIVEAAEGEERMRELQDDYRNSVENSWTYIFRLMEDLSHSGDE
jgi:hypothetical protein